MKPNRKGVNTFSAFQENKQKGRAVIIVATITAAKDNRLKFDVVTHLARYVAAQISKVQGKPCSASTLLRNARYKLLLRGYFSSDQKSATRADGGVLSCAGGAAETRQSRIELSNLKHENTRLKARLSAIDGFLPGEVAQTVPALLPQQTRLFEEDFILTCQALQRVIEALEDFVALDERGCLVDPSKRVDNVIVDARLARPFAAWHRSNRRR